MIFLIVSAFSYAVALDTSIAYVKAALSERICERFM
jgi:hypothetical protein